MSISGPRREEYSEPEKVSRAQEDATAEADASVQRATSGTFKVPIPQGETSKPLLFRAKLQQPETARALGDTDAIDLEQRKEENRETIRGLQTAIYASALTSKKGMLTPKRLEKDSSFQKLLDKIKHAVRSLISGPGSQEDADTRVRSYLSSLQESVTVEGSSDLGGHGGNKVVSMIAQDGSVKHLFLKKANPSEVHHYGVIGEIAPNLLKFMPRVYGTVTIANAEYLVMENTRKSTEGGDPQQLADVKISGHVSLKGAEDEGKKYGIYSTLMKRGLKNFNPICSMEEVHHTGREKSLFDELQMRKGAESAPGFMIPEPGSSMRFFGYSRSEETLHKQLAQSEVTADKVQALIKNLTELKEILDKSEINLIGASVMINKDNQGNLHPVLIDPAHLQVYPHREPSLPQGRPLEEDRLEGSSAELYNPDQATYKGSPAEYRIRKVSCRNGFDSLIKSLNRYMTVLKKKRSL